MLATSFSHVLVQHHSNRIEMISHPFRYWLALHPDIRRPIGGAKQMHRLAEALNYLGRDATIIQDDASFHPGWFSSNVHTISQSDFRLRTELRSDRDIVILPDFLPNLPDYLPGLPKLVFNQNALIVLDIMLETVSPHLMMFSIFMSILISNMFFVFHGMTRYC